MSKKHQKKTASKKAVAETNTAATEQETRKVFGCDDVPDELAAIVAEAEVRLAQEAQLI
ncbi:MAG: hypothetical protein ACRCWW_13000 [Scandinavium sp.]|uniref:hypothetical protein n=1 Tax=Scandinavium sp. TaxID=2830653 RepID=UPI003F39459C